MLVESAGFDPLLKKPRWYITNPPASTAMRIMNAMTMPTALLSLVPGEFVTIVSAI